MTRSLLLLTVGTIALSGALVVPAPAHADPYPPGTFPNGSYRKTCSNIHFKTDDPYTLRANCKPKADDTAAAESSLDISPCRDGTIDNDNGKLTCPYDHDTKNVSDATRNHGAFASAGVIIMGQNPDIPTTVKWMLFGFAHTKFMSELDHHTLDFTQATQILRQYLVEQATPQERRDVYRAAYRQVYGMYPGIIVPGSDYDAEMKAGKAWYSTIVIAERKKKAAPVPAPKPTGGPPPPPIG